jgi:hypothetical protein
MAASERTCANCGKRGTVVLVAWQPHYDRGKVRTTKALCKRCEQLARPKKLEGEVQK